MEGFKNHRLLQHPEEELFVEKFFKQFPKSIDLEYIVFGFSEKGITPKDCLSERERKIAVSLIQWLGSPVGLNFLKECGFVAKQK